MVLEAAVNTARWPSGALGLRTEHELRREREGTVQAQRYTGLDAASKRARTEPGTCRSRVRSRTQARLESSAFGCELEAAASGPARGAQGRAGARGRLASAPCGALRVAVSLVSPRSSRWRARIRSWLRPIKHPPRTFVRRSRRASRSA